MQFLTQRAQEVLYESEAALRLVDQELHDQHEVPRGRHNTPPAGQAEIPQILFEAQEHITRMLLQLRESRAMLPPSSAERLELPHEGLREVSSATDVAATMDMEQRLREVSKLLGQIYTASRIPAA